jgi:hypothetical protein
VYAICPDKAVAETIKTIEMNREERTRYFLTHESKAKEGKLALEENEIGGDEGEQGGSSEESAGEEEEQSRTQGATGEADSDDEAESAETRKSAQYYLEEDLGAGDKLTKINLEEDPYVRNHIIVVGMHSSIENFIMPLRTRVIKESQVQKIVIITGNGND